MISISKRLRMVASLIPPCEILADVGTDHGYLPVWLVQNQIARHVLASDVREGPLRRARDTVDKQGLSYCIDIFLADGLSDPRSKNAEVISICGMGGETMISILSAAPWTREGRIIVLQPQSKLAELEQWLCSNGYAVIGAKLCRDSGKLYLALRVQGGTWCCSAEDWLSMDRDPLFPDYLREELRKVEYAMEGLRRSQSDRQAELNALERRRAQLQEYGKENTTW